MFDLINNYNKAVGSTAILYESEIWRIVQWIKKWNSNNSMTMRYDGCVQWLENIEYTIIGVHFWWKFLPVDASVADLKTTIT